MKSIRVIEFVFIFFINYYVQCGQKQSNKLLALNKKIKDYNRQLLARDYLMAKLVEGQCNRNYSLLERRKFKLIEKDGKYIFRALDKIEEKLEVSKLDCDVYQQRLYVVRKYLNRTAALFCNLQARYNNVIKNMQE